MTEEKKNVAQKFTDAKEYSVDKAKELGGKVDENVRERPYHYVLGAAVIGLLAGILIGRKSN